MPTLKRRKSTIQRAAEHFARELGGTLLTLPYQPDYCDGEGRCILNVEDKVRRVGGDLQHGWQIATVYNGGCPVVLMAVQHVVWRTPEGALVDLTPASAGGRVCLVYNNCTYFVVDDRLEWIEFRPGVRVPAGNKYKLMSQTRQAKTVLLGLQLAEQHQFATVDKWRDNEIAE